MAKNASHYRIKERQVKGLNQQFRGAKRDFWRCERGLLEVQTFWFSPSFVSTSTAEREDLLFGRNLALQPKKIFFFFFRSSPDFPEKIIKLFHWFCLFSFFIKNCTRGAKIISPSQRGASFKMN